MKVCFFDDSAEGIKTIRAYCDSHCRENISYSLNPDLTDFFRDLDSCGISLIFLDTRVVRGSLGSFELAKKIREASFCVHIVFMSAYYEDMPFCFQNLIRPSGFLLKNSTANDIDSILNAVTAADSVPETSAVKISVRAGGEQFSFSTDEIMYFTTIGKKLALKTSDCQTVEFYGTLKDIESKYSEYFLRCHSGFLVNKKYIRRFSKSSIKLKNSAEELPVSKKYVKNVTNFAHLS